MRDVVLFDVDRTLVKGSDVKDELAFPRAIREVYGVEAGLDMITPHGMTDQQIIIELATLKGVERDTAREKIGRCMDRMADIYSRQEDEVELVEGVEEALEFLENAGFRLGLVTGNVRGIALGKLESAGIREFFEFGGYGDDAFNRPELVENALERAGEKYGETGKVLLVGDSPQDIRAGKETGVIAVGITEGVYSQKELESESADFILDGWRNMERLEEVFGDG